MNEERTKSPIDLMADMLATMATRATEAEHQLEEVKKSSDEWYRNWQRKDEQLKETEAKLAAEIEEHQSTRQALREAMTNTEKGAQQNG